MRIKRLYIFLLKTFLPLFIMTFGICLFIILMQFLWKYIDDMVGKGIELSVLAEMLSYAALSLVPMALPLSVLLASLMTFGSLGEQFELLAMKAAGISLFRIMKPLIVVLCFVAVGAFYFQNNIIPPSQVKMWTLLYSMRQKSPELDIPEKTFSSEVEGYNIYVETKESDGLLRNLMIYDHSEGFNKARVIVADSGRLKMATNKLYLILSMYSGEAFENLNSQKSRERNVKSNEPVPYRKETFKTKEILIKFDANFNRVDESLMQNRYIGKDLADLRRSIDSMTLSLDSAKEMNATLLYNQSYKKTLNEYRHFPVASEPAGETAEELPDFDEIYRSKAAGARLALLTRAKSAFENMKSEYVFKSTLLAAEEKEMRRHHTEMHKKFTLSFACLVFFFIGAPLGAIIRKGGLGMPTVISVFLFIFYYIIDNIGFKMASNGMWTPWEGMWLSSAVLLPLGIFLTYKAVNDSVILNADTYIDGFKKWMGIRISRKIEKKEVIMFQLDNALFRRHTAELKQLCESWLAANRRWIPYLTFWKRGGKDDEAARIAAALEQLVEEGSNSDRNLVLNKLMDFPVINSFRWTNVTGQTGVLIGWFFPVGLPIYLVIVYRRKFLLADIRSICQVCDELMDITDK